MGCIPLRAPPNQTHQAAEPELLYRTGFYFTAKIEFLQSTCTPSE